METLYRSVSQHRMVNPGFLSGPFLPIYGIFASLIILSSGLIADLSRPWQFTWFVLISTLLEYAAGWYFERFYHLQLWSYHGLPFNVQGRICLPFSLIWGALGMAFYLVINPMVQLQLQRIPLTVRFGLTLCLTAYILWDLFRSSLLLHRLEQFVSAFHEHYERLELEKFHLECSPFYRLLHTYPKMRHTVTETMALLHYKLKTVENFLKEQRKKLSMLKDKTDSHLF